MLRRRQDIDLMELKLARAEHWRPLSRCVSPKAAESPKLKKRFPIYKSMNNISTQSKIIDDIAIFEPDMRAIRNLFEFFDKKKYTFACMPVWLFRIKTEEIEECYVIGLDTLIAKLDSHAIISPQKPFQIFIHRIKKIFRTNSHPALSTIQQLTSERPICIYYSEWHVYHTRFISDGLNHHNVCCANLYAQVNQIQRGRLCWFSFDKEDMETAAERGLNWYFDIALPIRINGNISRAWMRKVFYIPAKKSIG